MGPMLRWAAYLDERMVGYSGLRLPDGENAHVGIAIAKVTVHPDFRGRGLGTELLREMLPALRAADRTDVEAWSVLQGSAGERQVAGARTALITAGGFFFNAQGVSLRADD